MFHPPPPPQKLNFYPDANTSDNPSKILHLTEETKVSIKGDKLHIETEETRKQKKYEFKVESGGINMWKKKLDDEIRKPVNDAAGYSGKSSGSQKARSSFENYDQYDKYEKYVYDGEGPHYEEEEKYDTIDEDVDPPEIPNIRSKQPALPPPKLGSGKKEMPPPRPRLSSIPCDSYIDEEEEEYEEEGPIKELSVKKPPPPKPTAPKKPMPAPKPVFKQFSSSIDDANMDKENQQTFPKKLCVNKPIPHQLTTSALFKKETFHLILL